MKLLCILLLAALLLSACSLDDFLYNEERLDHYTLPSGIIPESDYQMVTFSAEGHTLYGFWITPPDSLDCGVTVLYCHGNKHQLGEYWERAGFFYEMGLRCLIFDYEGFGRSEGSPSASALYADGLAALEFLRDSLHVPADSLVLYGYSLGNVVSIDLAAHHVRPLCLIGESPFASAEALFQTATPLDLPGGFVTDDPVDNAACIRGIRTPYLQLHGADDDYVPWNSNGRLVFENAPEPKQLELVPGANHNDVPDVMTHDVYKERLRSFIFSVNQP